MPVTSPSQHWYRKHCKDLKNCTSLNATRGFQFLLSRSMQSRSSTNKALMPYLCRKASRFIASIASASRSLPYVSPCSPTSRSPLFLVMISCAKRSYPVLVHHKAAHAFSPCLSAPFPAGTFTPERRGEFAFAHAPRSMG